VFEEMTYESILEDMLSRVTSDVDKREGSIIYDALAPCAYQLAQNYFNLSNFIDLVSGDTAVGEYLDRVVADYGITRKPATKAVRKIITTGPVQIGTRWGLAGTVYVITNYISDNTYQAECEQTGETGNLYSGTLENIDNVSGIQATIGEIITAGEEEETDENLRARFYAQVQSSGTSGNVNDYRNWALEVPGVGGAKVYPLWNGNGTVKVIIVNSNMAIDSRLEQAVYEHIEAVRPIGANVTVESPTSWTVNVNANVALDGTKTLAEVQTAFADNLASFLRDITFDTYTISYAKIGNMLLSTDGVLDYDTLLVNGGSNNLIIGDTQIPIIGAITLTEV